MTLFGLFGVLSIALVVGQLASVQHAALMKIYSETGCSATLCPRFAANQPCTGIDIDVGCRGTNVVGLSLSGSGLTGTIPSDVGQLTALTYLSFDGNGLIGTIPSQVGQLTSLTYLGLSNNALIGTIPSTFSRLTKLQRLRLDHTQINGMIPSTTAPLNSSCTFDRTFLDCATKPTSCLCSARLLNDDCANRRPIGTGSTSVSAARASTCVVGCGSCAMENDAWWEWTASCTGNATISTCGFMLTNTTLGIYRGTCPSALTPTATIESGSADCNDFGSCGNRGEEEATLAVVSGERIIIRLGTASRSVSAAGTLSITCPTITTAPTTTTPAAATTTAVVASATTRALSTSVGATLAPTTSIGTATPTTMVTTASASTTAAVTANASISATAPAVMTTTDATANASSTATSPANASISVTAPATMPSSGGTDVGLIAGVVGGIAALLLVIGVLAILVWRRRRSAAPDGTAMVPPTSQYALTSAAFRPDDVPHYDRLTPKEAAKSHYEQTGAEFKPKDGANYDRLTPQESN